MRVAAQEKRKARRVQGGGKFCCGCFACRAYAGYPPARCFHATERHCPVLLPCRPRLAAGALRVCAFRRASVASTPRRTRALMFSNAAAVARMPCAACHPRWRSCFERRRSSSRLPATEAAMPPALPHSPAMARSWLWFYAACLQYDAITPRLSPHGDERIRCWRGGAAEGGGARTRHVVAGGRRANRNEKQVSMREVCSAQ